MAKKTAKQIEEMNNKLYDNFKTTEGSKIDNFDFYEFGEHLTNSITDKLYRSYLPPLERTYRAKQEMQQDNDLSNDFDVDHLVDKIKSKIEDDIVEDITGSVKKRVKSELEEQYHPKPKSVEAFLDEMIKFPRYIIALGFFGLYVIMLCLSSLVLLESYDIGSKTIKLIFGVFSAETIDLRVNINNIVASTLSVLDLLLVGSLSIMVLVGVFENTISRIGMTHNVPTWFGKLGIGQLKIKVAASIVIISSIHLLVLFLGLDLGAGSENYNYQALQWTAIVHGVFVLSALALAVVEYVNKYTDVNRR